MPAGIYFGSDFTVTVWVKLYSVQNYVRILDFGKGTRFDNIIISAGMDGLSTVGFWIFNESKHSLLKSLSTLKLNTWVHIAVVLKDTLASIYLNGILDSSGQLFKPRNELRMSNFIGKSNWAHDPNADASFDEIKIFNRALFIEEIIEEAKSNNISFNSTMEEKQFNKNGLVHAWSFNGNMLNDEINGYDLSEPKNVHLATDRFDNSNSALQLENGYLKVPLGVYFSDSFTVTVWFKLNSLRYNSRIIDFGDGVSDNVVIGFDELTSHIVVMIFDESYKTEMISKTAINLNVWTYLAVVFHEGKAEIYLNGTCDSSGSLYIPRNVRRFSNFIGKSNWATNQNIHAYLDDLKIFNRALTSSEINEGLSMVKIQKVESASHTTSGK